MANDYNLEPTPVATAEEYARRFPEAVVEYMKFLEQHRLLTVRPWMAPALAARQGRFASGPREFFSEVSYRDLWIVSYIPLVGRRGQRHPRAGREGVASEYPPLPPLPRRREIAEELSDPVVRGR